MKTIIQAIAVTLIGLLAPLYMIPLVFLIRWDKEPSYLPGHDANHPYDPSFVIRGDLPEFLAWAQTIDMRYPGGMYEPAMRAALGNGGYWRRLWTAYLWTGHRNRAQGLAAWFGHPTTDYIPDPFSTDRDRSDWSNDIGDSVKFKRGLDVQTWSHIAGRWYFVHGFNAYKLQDGSFFSLPWISFKRVPV